MTVLALPVPSTAQVFLVGIRPRSAASQLSHSPHRLQREGAPAPVPGIARLCRDIRARAQGSTDAPRMRPPPPGLSRERCGKQSTRWRRRPGEARGAGEDGGTATCAALVLCPGWGERCVAKLWGGGAWGGQQPGRQHPVAVPGARSPGLRGSLVPRRAPAAAARGSPRCAAGCRFSSASPGGSQNRGFTRSLAGAAAGSSGPRAG